MTTKKRQGPLFVDEDEPETKPVIPSPSALLIVTAAVLEVKETKELTNILGYGPRFGKPWMREEELLVLYLLEKGDTIDQIASKMCRSAISIGCRICSDFNCKYKIMQGDYTAASLGFDVADIKKKIEAFGNTIINHVNDMIRKQAENPTNIVVAIDPPHRVKYEKPEGFKPKKSKQFDELCSLMLDVQRKLDYLIERTM
jgi:hypothetical protein